jgi:hypothetical protein
MSSRQIMLSFAFLLAASAPLAAHADDMFAGLDKGCVSVLLSAGYKGPQARGLCAQYSPDEKHCVIESYRRHHDFHRSQLICLQVDGDRLPPYGESPYPWARGGGYCEHVPNDVSCQEGFGFWN